MASRRDRPLVRKNEPSQKTVRGLEIPVSKRRYSFGALDEVAKEPRPGVEGLSIRSRKVMISPRPSP